MIRATKVLIPRAGATGFLSSFSPVLSGSPIVVAFAISLVIGLVAGGCPAWRAAGPEPIEAVGHE